MGQMSSQVRFISKVGGVVTSDVQPQVDNAILCESDQFSRINIF